MKLMDKIFFFIISVSPVYVIMIILKVDMKSLLEILTNNGFFSSEIIRWGINNIFSMFFLVALIFSMGLQFIYSRKFSEASSTSSIQKHTVLEVKDQNSDFLAFFATYLLPLFTFQMDGIRYFLVFLFTYIIFGILFVKSNLYYNNIGLLLFDYNVVVIKTKFNDNGRIQERRFIIKGKRNIPRVNDLIEADRIDEKDNPKAVYLLKNIKRKRKMNND